MKVTLLAVGFVNDDDGCDIEDMVNHTTLDLPRIPCKGERMGLWIDDMWIDARLAVWQHWSCSITMLARQMLMLT